MIRLVLVIFLIVCSPVYAEEVEIYGAIRNTGDGWHVLDNKYHRPSGIRSVETKSSYITVNYDFTALQVHTFLVTPDETYAQRGLTCGASVGLTLSYIKCSQNGMYIDLQSLNMPSGNLWLYGKFTR